MDQVVSKDLLVQLVKMVLVDSKAEQVQLVNRDSREVQA